MKRILRISLDILVTSVVPIAGWFLLGIILGGNLINVFSLTYPIQFIMNTFKSIFSTGANVSAYKDNNKNAVNSGILLGIVLGALIFGIIIFNIEKYISFMNMDINTYKIFGIYSIIQIYLQLVLQFILTKLYYKEENKKANKIAITFNLINFITLIGTAIITRDELITCIVSIFILLIYTVIIVIKNMENFKISINLARCVKYDSVELFTSINFFIIYLFGLSNAFEFGERYVLAITFSTLVTDMQWDVTHAIGIVAKIDLSKGKFSYKEHLKNAYKLISMLIASIIIMSLTMYNSYNTDLLITGIFILGEILCFIMYPLYTIKTYYLQLEYSPLKTTIHKQIANILRTIMSFIPTPYCTLIGQLVSMFYQLIYTQILAGKTKIYEINRKIN